MHITVLQETRNNNTTFLNSIYNEAYQRYRSLSRLVPNCLRSTVNTHDLYDRRVDENVCSWSVSWDHANTPETSRSRNVPVSLSRRVHHQRTLVVSMPRLVLDVCVWIIDSKYRTLRLYTLCRTRRRVGNDTFWNLQRICSDTSCADSSFLSLSLSYCLF